MSVIFAVCLTVVTAAFVVAVVYFVQTLVSVKKAADELETLLKSVNREADMVTNITGKIKDLVSNLSSPWAKAGGWLGGIISTFVRNKREEQQRL